MDILWSSGYTDFCDNIYLDECSEDCGICHNGVIDYDGIDDIIMEDLHNMFGKNEHRYFIFKHNYKDIYSKSHNNKVISNFYSTIEDLIFKGIQDGNDIIRIYKDKCNSITIERSHHDGKEYFKLGRLNKKGLRRFNLGNYYSESDMLDNSKNYMQYVYKSVYNDFKDNW